MDELEKSLIPFWVALISRPLTDFEITASSYCILPIIVGGGLWKRQGGAFSCFLFQVDEEVVFSVWRYSFTNNY